MIARNVLAYAQPFFEDEDDDADEDDEDDDEDEGRNAWTNLANEAMRNRMAASMNEQTA